MRRRAAALALVLAAVLVAIGSAAQPADDETRNAARDLATQAREQFNAQQWAKALDLYQRAYDLVPAPTIAVRKAYCLVELGRLVEAEEAFMLAVRTKLDAGAPEPFVQAVEGAKAAVAELRPRIPRLQVVLDGADPKSPGVEVKIDGKVVPPALVGVERPIDPGEHTVEASAAGGAPIRRSFALREGEQRAVAMRMAPAEAAPAAAVRGGPGRVAPAEPEKPRGNVRRTLGWVALGVGAAGLGFGVFEGVRAVGKKSDLDDVCHGGACPPSAEGDLDAFRSARTLSTIGYVVGAVGVGAGVVLVLTAPRGGEHGARVGISVGATGVQVGGAF